MENPTITVIRKALEIGENFSDPLELITAIQALLENEGNYEENYLSRQETDDYHRAWLSEF